MNERRPLIPTLSNSVSLRIEEMPISALKLNARNPRKHPEKQIAMWAHNIDRFGISIPCLIDENNCVLTGTVVVLAADRLGMKTVPVIRISHLSETEKRAFIVAVEKLAEMSEWDRDILRGELQFFSDLGIEFSTIGFETAEVDIILGDTEGDADDDGSVGIMVNGKAVCRPGDLWRAGRHLVLCGDTLVPGSYEALLHGERARLVITWPPLPMGGPVGGAADVQRGDGPTAPDETSSDSCTSFLAEVMGNLTAHSVDGSLHYIGMDWRHCREALTIGGATYSQLLDICVWRKPKAGGDSLYGSQHEFVFVFKNGTAPHIDNVNLGGHGRTRSNVWDHGATKTPGKRRGMPLAVRSTANPCSTARPVALVADIIKDASARGDLVLDGFGGTGGTLLAAEKTGRRAAVIEIDPRHVDTAIRRWQALTGKQAICARSGAPFAEREAAVSLRGADTPGFTNRGGAGS
jgi:hypothetical protein